MADYRTYSVRAGMSGRMVVDVPLGAIKLRGERNAVLAYAWDKLMGEDSITGKVNKSLETRRFLMAEIRSRYKHQQTEVYELFCTSVRYSPMGNTIR